MGPHGDLAAPRPHREPVTMPQRDESDVDGFEVGRDGSDPQHVPMAAAGLITCGSGALSCGATRAATPVASPGSIARSVRTTRPVLPPPRFGAGAAGRVGRAGPARRCRPSAVRTCEQWRTMWFRQVTRQVEAALTAQREPPPRHVRRRPGGQLPRPSRRQTPAWTDLLAQPGVRGLLRAAFREEERTARVLRQPRAPAWEATRAAARWAVTVPFYPSLSTLHARAERVSGRPPLRPPRPYARAYAGAAPSPDYSWRRLSAAR